MPGFKTVSYLDKACTGLEAFSLLLPAGWKFGGGIRWSVDNTMMPATCGFKITGDGIEVQVLPGQAFYWNSLTQVRMSHPVGSRYLGATVCPPLNASEFLTNIMLPALRPDAESLSSLRESPSVDMGSTLGFDATFESSGSASSDGAKIRVEYRQGDVCYEEELCCTVTTFRYNMLAGIVPVESIFWMADHLVSFRAEPGRLDEVKDVLQTILYSFRTNPQWMERYIRIGLYLKDRQINKPYSLRQLGTDIGQLSAKYADGLRTSDLRQSGYRWIANSLCGAGSTGEYYDPIQQICVRLPAGYEYAWASDAGEYLLSNNRDEPAVYGFADMWEPMELISLESPVLEESVTPATCA